MGVQVTNINEGHYIVSLRAKQQRFMLKQVLLLMHNVVACIQI